MMSSDTPLLIKLIEQTNSAMSIKIDSIGNKLDNLDKITIDFAAEHKEHDHITYETRTLLENHLRGDEVYQRNVDNSLKEISDTLKLNTDSLIAHMRRTEVLEKLHSDNKKRIELLEEPSKEWKILRKYIIGTLTGASFIAGLVYTIMGIFKK